MIKDFGMLKDGQQAKLYVLENQNGMQITVSDYGATLVDVMVADKNGQLRDVVLGYDNAEGYESGDKFFGATVGRSANRIGNAQFELNGTTYKLTANDNENNLHSGPDFYNQRMWEVKELGEHQVTFALHSPDGDQGYPGAVDIQVTYELNEQNEVRIHYMAVPQRDTIINLTNHSYFNLSGQESGDILSHTVWLDADAYTRADAKSIPTGDILPVEGTPMDFRVKKTIGRDIEENYEALEFGGGYDHNWALNGTGYRKVGELASEESGIAMEIYTDLPGIQIYTGNFLEQEQGKGGTIYRKRQAVCFETQYFPDAVNRPQFKSPVIRAGEKYETVTTYKF